MTSSTAAHDAPGANAGGVASRWLSALSLGVAGLVMCFHPTLFSRFARVQEEIGDTRFNAWLLEHAWRWAIRDPIHLHFFDPPMDFPARNTLAYSDTLLGSAPLYFLWRALGFAADTSFQLWEMTASAANFAAALLFFRRGLRLAPWASAAGAALFAFGGPRIAELGHAQMLAHFALPLLALAIVRLADPGEERRAGWWIALAAFSIVDQFYAGYYLGWFDCLAVLIAAIWVFAARRTRQAAVDVVRRYRGKLVTGGIAALLALAPLGIHYVMAARETGQRPFRVVLHFLPRLASWLGTSGRSWLYGWTRPIADRFLDGGEHLLGFGFLTTALGIAGLVRRRRDRAFWLLGISTLTIFVLTFNPFARVTLWGVVYYLVPGAKAIRGVGRIAILLLFPIGAGVAAVLDGLERRRAGAWLAALLAALVLVEQGMRGDSFDKATDRTDIAWLASRIPPACATFYFTPVDASGPWYKYEIDAMWASTQAQVPTINGYSGSWPRSHPGPEHNMISAPGDRDRVAALLQRWIDARHIAFDPRCWIAEVPRDSRR